jgi:hypothetical protein
VVSQFKTEARSLDLRAYQAFWATVSPALVQRYRGKSVAVKRANANVARYIQLADATLSRRGFHASI